MVMMRERFMWSDVSPAIEVLVHFDGWVFLAGLADDYGGHAGNGGMGGHVREHHAAGTHLGAGADFDAT
jgi:hypothetical protein